MAKKKTKKKRSLNSNPGLNKHLFSKVKQEYHDIDYADKLNPKDKMWLSQFMEEHLGARLDHGKKPFHKTKRLRKDCYDRNNARQRDIYGLSRATGRLFDIESAPVEEQLEEISIEEDYEELLIKKIDKTK